MSFRLREGHIPTKPRSRSVPDVAVLSAQTFTVCLLSADVFQGASFGICPSLKLVCFLKHEIFVNVSS